LDLARRIVRRFHHDIVDLSALVFGDGLMGSPQENLRQAPLLDVCGRLFGVERPQRGEKRRASDLCDPRPTKLNFKGPSDDVMDELE